MRSLAAALLLVALAGPAAAEDTGAAEAPMGQGPRRAAASPDTGAAEAAAAASAAIGVQAAAAGRWEEAIGHFSRSIAALPNAVAYGNRGNAYRYLGRPDSAIADYDEVIRRQPRNAIAYNNRANARRDLGDYEGALRDLDSALALDAAQPVPRLNRGWTALLAGRPDSALADARLWIGRAGAADPASPYFAILARFAAAEAGREAQGDSILREVLAAGPADRWPAPVLRHLLGDLSLDALLSAIRDDGPRLEARVYAGIALALAGRRAEALEHLRWAAEHGNRTYIEFDLALAFARRLETPPARTEGTRRRRR